MNKKLLIFVLILLTAVFLTASFVGCDGDGEKGTYVLAIDNIVGVSDAVIDNEAKTVAFRVQNSIDAFPLSSITFKDGEMLVYEAYADEALTQKYEGASIPLVEGDNVFWVKGWFALAADKYAVYKFTVTRTRSEQSVKSIKLDEETWKSLYMVNEKMPQCYIIVTYSDDTTEKVLLTADMITGFDTSSPGIREITISYKGSTLTTSVEVKEVTGGDGALTLGAWQTAYFIGEEIYLDGAYLLYDDGKTISRIAITADMVTGFDTSAEGTKQIKIVYGDKLILADIKVYAFDDGEYEEVKKSTLDVAKFETNMNKIFSVFGVNIYEMSEHDRNMLVDIFEYLGITDEDVESLVGTVAAKDSTLLGDIKEVVMNNTDVADILTENNVRTVTETLRIVKDKISAKQIAKLASIFVKMVYGYMDNVSIEDQDGWGYNIDFTDQTQSGHMTYSWVSITAQDMLKFINGDANALAVFEEYTSKEYSDYSQIGDIEKVLSMDETAYVAGAVLDSIAAACDYDEQKIFDMVALSKKIVEAVTTGDLDKLLGGQAEGLSYKAMVAQINELGKFLKTLNQTFADDPLLVRCGSAVLDEILNIWSDTMMVAFDGNTAVNAVVALEKVAIECLMKIDANFVAGLYLDYDDYAKESDEIVKDQKFGYIAAKIAAFVYPEYQKLELREKTAIDDATEMLNMIGVPFNIRGIVDFMEKAAVKDADDYSATELKAFADEFYKLIKGESVETEDRLFIMPYGTVLVNVNCTKEDLAQAIAQSAQVVLYDASLGTNLRIDDLSAYTINYDAGKEGFFSAEIVIEGAKATIECYAYDSTTPTKFVLYKDRHELNGYVFEKGQSVSAENGNGNFSFKHKETGKIITVSADITGFGSAVDTSEAGYSLSTIKYSNDIFGEIELPVLITVVDLANVTPDMVNTIYFQYCDILPQDSEILIHADVTFAFIFSESIDVIVTDLDSSTLGETTFTAALAENENGIDCSEQLKVTVVTKEEAMTVEDASVAVLEKNIVVPVGTTSNQIAASYDISYKYYPASHGSQDYVEYLNDTYLSEQGLKIIVKDFDTAQASDTIAPLKGKILLVSSADESIVFAESEFGYFVYDPDTLPPVAVKYTDDYWWGNIENEVYTESETKSLEAFLRRSHEIAENRGISDVDILMSDTSMLGLNELLEQDLSGRGKVILELREDRGQWKEYKVTFNIDYLHHTVDYIRVIPDAFKNLPTSISVGYAKNVVLQDEELIVENVTGSVEFGYGYDLKSISGQDEKDKLTIAGDTSSAGYKQFTVTYTLNGVTLKAESSINVISLETALGNSVSDMSYKSYLLHSDNATEGALLAEMTYGDGIYMLYNDFNINESVTTLKHANDYWENNGINVWFAVKNADGEYGNFDGSEGPLRTCTVYICAEYYGHYAEIEMFDVFYAVAPVGIREVTSVEWLSFDRKVIFEEEKNSGSWKDLVNITYIFAKTDNYEEGPLSEFLETYTGFTAELVYDNEREIFKVVVKGPYAYYRQNNIVVVPDNEANKLTNVYITESSQYIMADAQPVAGKDFRLTAEYGYGYKTTEIEDYSAVAVKLVEDLGNERRYEISYGEFTCDVFYQVLYDVYAEMNIQALQYDLNCSVDEVVIYGEITLVINGGNVEYIYSHDRNIADINRELQGYGLSLSLKDFDPTMPCYEQGEVRLVIGDRESDPVRVFERGKAIINMINLDSVIYSQNGDKVQTVVNGYISYSFMDEYGSVYEDISYYISGETLESLNGNFAQYNIVFDLVGLDTSLPAEGQNVCLQGGGCDSNPVVPEMRAE